MTNLPIWIKSENGPAWKLIDPSKDFLQISGWDRVGKVFKQADSCIDCPHHQEESESREDGGGFSYETMHECTLGMYQRDRPEHCPGYEQEES